MIKVGDGRVTRHLFGWTEKRLSVSLPQLEIVPHEDFDEAVSTVVESSLIDDNWLKMPVGQKRIEWPCTHCLKADPTVISNDLAVLLISVFGFLHGLKFTPDGIGHLHKTPRTCGTLVDFIPRSKDVEKALSIVIDFYTRHISNQEIISLTTAALHWYMTSQSYDHHFEKFAWQYIVLDNIHKLTSLICPIYRKQGQGHGHGHDQRPVNLAKHYEVKLHVAFSDQANPKPNAKVLARYRNQLIHEARWLNEPLGYKVDSSSHAVMQSLIRFNSQLILASLGIKCEFLKADYDRQRWGLDVS